MRFSSISNNESAPGNTKFITDAIAIIQNIIKKPFQSPFTRAFTLTISLFAFASNTYSQVYDLIVNVNHDSIACHIDSISANSIYFEARNKNKWIHTQYDKSQVLGYKLAAISKKNISFKRGTSMLVNPDSLRINQVDRNTVYGNGSFLLYYYTYSLNYERILSISEDSRKTWSFRIGGGFLNNTGKIAIASFNNLRGAGRNKFEMNVGAVYINEMLSSGSHYISPLLNIGYRRQSTDKRFVLRTGFGVPEGLYLSLGYSF